MKGTPRSVPVLICVGHTGGHFFPAISCAEAFRANHPEVDVHFLMSRMPKFAKEAAQVGLFHFHLIPFSALPPFFSLKALKFLLEYARAWWCTYWLTRKIKPRLVIGFGSYSSVPGVLCAALVGIPVLLHEQNAIAGRANRFLAYCAKRVAVSFPETQGLRFRSKVFWTGYPLRPTFEQIRERSQHKEGGRFTLLVFGGSQGARHLNQVLLEALSSFSAEERTSFAVIHIVGDDDLDSRRRAYQKLGIAAEVYDFSSQIFEQYKRADLVVARAGAGTIFELAAVGRAAILVPYPYAYAHQKSNAAYLVREGSAQLIEERELSAQRMREAITQLRKNRPQRLQLEKNIKRFSKPSASQILAEAGWELICKKN